MPFSKQKIFPMLKNNLTILLLLNFTFLLQAQENLTKDTPFFQAQAKVFQKWLEKEGLGTVLKVREVEVDPQILALYLEFKEQGADHDEVVINYQKIKQAFESKNTLPLEAQLFYKMVHLMEVDEDIANVQIYDTYNPQEQPCFYVGAYFKNNQIQIDKKIAASGECPNRYKGKKWIVQIDPSDFLNAKKITQKSIHKKFGKKQVFDLIFQYAKKRFEKNPCPNRKAKVRLRENKNMLRFEADNLCKQVLYDETNQLLCRIVDRMGFSCNTIKRERLNFIIIYEATNHGFILHCEVDGKYSSGLGKGRRGDYNSMEENPGFNDYLELFADEFAQELRKEITK